MPRVLICDNNPEVTPVMENAIDGVGEIAVFLYGLARNPMDEILRTAFLEHNVSYVFEKYPRLEEIFAKEVNTDDIPDFMKQLIRKYFYSNISYNL